MAARLQARPQAVRVGEDVGAGSGRRWRAAAGAAAVLGVLSAAVLLAGARGVVLAASGVLAVGLAVALVRRRVRDRRVERVREQVAHAAGLLASHLRAGQVPSAALARAAEDFAVLRPARGALQLGGDPVAVWHAQAAREGEEGLGHLARAWQVATATGAPMAATLEQVGQALISERKVRAVVAGELAAPRATAKVMAALPVCGIGLGYLLGGNPLGWLVAGPPGWICILAGVTLACAGLWWIEVLARRAAS